MLCHILSKFVSSKNNLVSGGANVAEMLAGGRVNGNCNVMYAIAHETGTNNFIINKLIDIIYLKYQISMIL